ncbi:MAG: prephenate dehydrogenase/arogenate dehydrogenase family protein, partial [Chloroflexi bacterium]|nr:prephenate dehydrogenase/arogenate dehydrogenase family protein [Chloroflexota bacterium]
MDRIVIIGMGLIGGSLGMALKRSKIAGVEIVGVDEDRNAVTKAERKKAIDRWERPAAKAVESANLIIVATPIMAMRSVFEEIAPALQPGAIVTDVASTKTQVLRWAKDYLPDRVHFVGGHPMAGKETAGIDAADALLFQGSTYCILPGEGAAPAAVETVVGLAQSVGAEAYFVGSDEHDVLVAGISHLPMLLASALVEVTSGSASWQEMSKLAASGFRDTSRLASSDSALRKGISLTNQGSMIRWLDEYIDVLKDYREKLADGGENLMPRLEIAKDARDRWVCRQKDAPRDPSMADIPSFTQRMSEMFGGRLLGRAAKRRWVE